MLRIPLYQGFCFLVSHFLSYFFGQEIRPFPFFDNKKKMYFQAFLKNTSFSIYILRMSCILSRRWAMIWFWVRTQIICTWFIPTSSPSMTFSCVVTIRIFVPR